MKTSKEQIIELMTGISIEQWEENNKKLDLIMKKCSMQGEKDDSEEQELIED